MTPFFMSNDRVSTEKIFSILALLFIVTYIRFVIIKFGGSVINV